MAKRSAIVNLIEYDDTGRATKRPVRLNLTLATSEEPQKFYIELPDKRATRHTCIQVTRAEIERVLTANRR